MSKRVEYILPKGFCKACQCMPCQCKEPDSSATRCMVCNTNLGVAGGYANTDMCGPCCTGEADTITEKGHTW